MQANDVQLNTIGSKNIWEVKAGVDMQMNKKWDLWSYIAYQKGKDDYRKWFGSLNVKYKF